MSLEQWLLGLHVLGAFLFVSGAVLAGALQLATLARERPSEIAFLLGLSRIAVAIVGVGGIVALGLGTWLVDRFDFSWSETWIGAALALLVASVILGAVGGRFSRHTRYLAERLSLEGDEPSPELRQRLTAPLPGALNIGSFLAAVAILALMVWKPGA